MIISKKRGVIGREVDYMPRAKKICLFIAPRAKEPEGRIIQSSDQVYENIVKQAAKKCGYYARRVDKLPGASERTVSKIFRHLYIVPMVVADLTGLDPNVLYELGIRHGLGKPIVPLIQKGHKLPSDIFDVPTVLVNLKVNEIKESRKKLAAKIKEAKKEEVTKARKMRKGLVE